MNIQSTTLPLSEARERWELAHPRGKGPKPRGRPPKSPQEPEKVDAGVVIGMKAAGIPLTRIAQAMEVREPTVRATLARIPDAQERIAHYREALKVLKIERAHRVEGKVWARFENEVDAGDAKSVDAVARALGALEKIQVSASGEAQRVDVQHTVENPIADIKVMIANLLESPL